MQDEQTTRTELSTLGEFGLIKRLTKKFKSKNDSTVKAVGDDAAVINNKDKQTLISTDMLVEGIHFDLMYMPLKHLGYKAVVVNLSDIYAMNALPKQITISLAISNRFSVEGLEELYEGISHACEVYGVDLIGGDTCSSPKGLVISVTAVGEAKAEDIVYRTGAQVNDLLCVSGDLGASYLGLQILEREKRIFLEDKSIMPDLENQEYLIGRQLKPEARRDVIEIFKQINIKPTSMIDVSDGLASEIFHLCEQNKTGCRLFEEKIPISEEAYNMALKFKLDPTTCALSGGEDYELLFTIKPEEFEKVQPVSDFSVIGFLTPEAEGINLYTKGGNVHALTAQGWNAFTEK